MDCCWLPLMTACEYIYSNCCRLCGCKNSENLDNPSTANTPKQSDDHARVEQPPFETKSSKSPPINSTKSPTIPQPISWNIQREQDYEFAQLESQFQMKEQEEQDEEMMAAAIKASLNNEIHNSPGASSSQISITIPDEPATDNEEAVLINFRLPNGTSEKRRFLRSNNMGDVLLFVMRMKLKTMEDEKIKNFQLHQPFNKQIYDEEEKSIAECFGIKCKRINLVVSEILS